MVKRKRRWRKLPEAVRREAILKAGQRCLARRGFERTTMDEVAAEANLTKGGMYFHFRNKEELFQAVVLAMLELGRQSMPAYTPADDPLDYLRTFLHAWLARMSHDLEDSASHFRIYYEAWNKPVTRRHIAAFYEESRRHLMRVARDGQAHGRLRKDRSPKSIALLAVGMLDGLLLQAEISERRISFVREGRALIEIVLQSLAP
jgi:AcrR family transcriptional regulator